MIFPGDVVICETIRRGLEDLRKDIWLLDDIFGTFVKNPALKDKYGQKEIDAAKEWFKNNNIAVVMRYRDDSTQMPLVTVALGGSSEKDEQKTLGELDSEIETLMPNTIGKPIPYIVKPFTPASLVGLTVTAPNTTSLRSARAGQILVDMATGTGYVIEDIIGKDIILAALEEGAAVEGNSFAIIPQFPFYRARRKHTFFQETYQIGCHVHGDPAPLLWLHPIILYILLRYRESLLEGQCFAESSLSSSDLMINQELSTATEKAFSRYITLSGQVENSWIHSPQRVIEAVELAQNTANGIRTGITICTNLDSPEFLDTEDEAWLTKKESSEE